MKSGNLNFLEPSGPLQACDGTALPYIYIYIYIKPDNATFVPKHAAGCIENGSLQQIFISRLIGLSYETRRDVLTYVLKLHTKSSVS